MEGLERCTVWDFHPSFRRIEVVRDSFLHWGDLYIAPTISTTNRGEEPSSQNMSMNQVQAALWFRNLNLSHTIYHTPMNEE